jgi:hypothetical protein
MFDNKKRVMERVAGLPKGTPSPSGRYWCVTCPLMSQKCMATPSAIADSKYTLRDLAHVYEITPDFSRRLIAALPPARDARAFLEAVLRDDWLLAIEPEPFESIAAHMAV